MTRFMALDLSDRAALIRSLPHGGTVVEVGVARGVFSKTILKENQPARLYLVDAWCSRPGTTWQARDPSALANHEHNYRRVQQLFADDKRVEVRRELSLEAAQKFSDGELDVVYLDADHTAVADDIRVWWPKVRPGGWLCGHDYAMHNWITVQSDVDAWIAQTGLQLHVTQEDWPSWAVQKCAPGGDVATVVTVYPPYADLLDTWLALLRRFWPKHPALVVGQSTKMFVAERMLADLRAINHEFVVMFHEDFHLCMPVKQPLFDKCLNAVRNDPKVISCSLTWEPCDIGIYHYPKARYSDEFEVIPTAWDYAINFQARIWRREALMRILAAIPPGTKNGTLEPIATKKFRRIFPGMRVISYAMPAPDNPSTFVDCTDKSHWIVPYKNVVHAGRR
jgi:hypothetical protein